MFLLHQLFELFRQSFGAIKTPVIFPLKLQGVPAFLGNPSATSGASDSDVRFPQLPCVKAGVEKGLQALQSLLFPLGGGTETAVATIKEAWKSHPEALLPLTAAVLIPQPPPEQAGQRRSFLLTQAELFQIAADSPSMLPKVCRLARFLAAQNQFELAQQREKPVPAVRQSCIANLRRALKAEETSASECRAYFRIAMELHEFDLARELISRWGGLAPASRDVMQSRIQVDLVTGAFGNALLLLDQMLAKDPTDAWALERRRGALESLEKGPQQRRGNLAQSTR